MFENNTTNQQPQNLLEGIQIYVLPELRENPLESILSILLLIGIFFALFFLT